MNIVVNDVALSFPEAATKEKEGIVKTTEDIQLNQEHTALRASGLGELNQIADGFLNATTVAPPLIRLPFLNCQTVNYGVPFNCEVICQKASVDGRLIISRLDSDLDNLRVQGDDGTLQGAQPEVVAAGFPLDKIIEKENIYRIFPIVIELATDKNFSNIVFSSINLFNDFGFEHSGSDGDKFVTFDLNCESDNKYVLKPDTEYFIRVGVVYGPEDDGGYIVPSYPNNWAANHTISSFRTLPLSQIGTVELKPRNYFNPDFLMEDSKDNSGYGHLLPYEDFSFEATVDGFVPDDAKYQFDLKATNTITQEVAYTHHYNSYQELQTTQVTLELGSYLLDFTVTCTKEDGTQVTGSTSYNLDNSKLPALGQFFPKLTNARVTTVNVFEGDPNFDASKYPYTSNQYECIKLGDGQGANNAFDYGSRVPYLSLLKEAIPKNTGHIYQELPVHVVWYEDYTTVIAEYDTVAKFNIKNALFNDFTKFYTASAYLELPTAEQLNLRNYGNRTVYLYAVQKDMDLDDRLTFTKAVPSDDIIARREEMQAIKIPRDVAETYPPVAVGTQPGEKGFGVGVYPGDDLADLGLQAMDGTDDPNSDNFGNYERADGKGIMVFIPAFCYSFEQSEIPSNVTSPSGFGFKWFSEFDYSEQKANDAGYILHEAFLDGTDTKSGFFIAKYLMSKGIKSVDGGIPISLCSSGSDVPSIAEGHGATGQAWDALTLSKTWGTGYNCASVYMYSALAMLSLVHGWHAKSTDVCAWYDAEGTTNYPKGCNNNALGDCDDESILYENSDTQQKQKPNTGSANHFAKTTHNGQMSGVCDLNGCMEQVTVGFILHGSTWYLRATNAKLIDYTKDNVNTTDSTVYHSTSLFSGNINGYWGKNGINAFFTKKNGDHRTLCGIVPNNNAIEGINEFGSDRARFECSDSNYGAMCCSGWWSTSSKAGVWKRYADSNNNNGWSWDSINAAWGFRCAAYGNK